MPVFPRGFSGVKYGVYVYPSPNCTAPREQDPTADRVVFVNAIYKNENGDVVQIYGSDKRVYRISATRDVQPTDLVVLRYLDVTPNERYVWEVIN